jgi:hypothetical protein
MLDGMKDLTKADIIKYYSQYAYLHMNNPGTALISSLSFADLRSASQALQNTGVRAYPIMNLALQHTPIIGINPDTPDAIRTKLKEMKTRLLEARQSIFEDERKGGVIPNPAGGAQPGGAGSMLPVGLPQIGSPFGGGKITNVRRVP